MCSSSVVGKTESDPGILRVRSGYERYVLFRHLRESHSDLIHWGTSVREMCVDGRPAQHHNGLPVLEGAMKRPARIPTQLSDSLHNRLNAYALAASAAGVGVLALVQPADAKIVYKSVHKVIDHNGQSYYLDLDGVKDFKLAFRYRTTSGNAGSSANVFPANKSNQIIGYNWKGHSTSFASALKSGDQIGPSGKFGAKRNVMAIHTYFFSTFYLGPWLNANGYGKGVTGRYLGLKFFVQGQAHYGWARLNLKLANRNGGIKMVTTLTGYAYETIPNKAIIAGKTHGRDEATLGRLAQGASGRPDQGKP
jgi:hypothetical protein